MEHILKEGRSVAPRRASLAIPAGALVLSIVFGAFTATGPPDPIVAAFDRADRDKDLLLSRAEWNAEYPRRAELFDEVDANRSNHVDPDEFHLFVTGQIAGCLCC